jgi:hypothetical protein
MPSKYYAIDAAPGLIKREVGLAAITATAYIGDQHDQGDAVGTDFITIINIEACKVSAGNEVYTFSVVGSNVADRSDAELLGQITLGDAGTIAVETRDTIAGDRAEIRCRSEKNDTEFRYLDLHLTAAGTSPSISFGAYISKEF